MTEATTFPIFIHLLTIPLTLGFGFLLGWVLRGAVGKKSPKRPGALIGGS